MIKNYLSKLTLAIALAGSCHPAAAQAQPQTKKPKLLIVVSGYGKDSGTTRPGYEFDEFSQAYLVFKNNGFEMEVASPKGGPVQPDEFNRQKSYNKTVVQDKKAMAMLAATTPTAKLKPANYDAVYIVGGKGAMFDLPYDPSLQDFLSAVRQRKGFYIATVCHGAAALVDIKDTAGRYLVQDHRVTGFSNKEEELFGKKWVKEFPFMLEDKLKERKAVYEQGPMMLPYVVVSGNIISGQNPYSTAAMAEALVAAMGRKPVARKWYTDEAGMYLVKRALNGEQDWAGKELATAKEKYDVELIAVYGYYRLIDKTAGNDDLRAGLLITELARPHYPFNELLWYEMATAYVKLNEKQQAKTLLEEIVAKKPDFEKAVELLGSMK